MRAQRFGDLRANRVDRIERRARLLEDHRYGAAAVTLQGAALQGEHVLAVKVMLPLIAERTPSASRLNAIEVTKIIAPGSAATNGLT